MKIQTGKGVITLGALLAIWSVSAVTSLPGLAVTPIMGDLERIFPQATDLEIQMLGSLPSLLIIPFVLLAGVLSRSANKLRLLSWGLLVFLLCGVASFFAKSMHTLILISSVLGMGAGIVIPFSTGLVVDYFTGEYRIRQLGYSSAINNLTLVLATALTGYLAGVDWHLPFLVYTIPVIPLVLLLFLRKNPPMPEPKQSIQLEHRSMDVKKLIGLMGFYFFATFTVLAVVFYAPFLVSDLKIDNAFSGVLISLFFLAIMLPGFFMGNLFHSLKRSINLVSLVLICLGLTCVGLAPNKSLMVAGAVLAGLGYGIIQPVIYDKAATIASPKYATLALSWVMSMNYTAVLVCPFLVDFIRDMFVTKSDRFPFFFNAALVLVLAIVTLLKRNNFTLGLGEEYYKL